MDLMLESLPRLLNATILTIELTLLSLFFGIFVGVFFAILRTSNKNYGWTVSLNHVWSYRRRKQRFPPRVFGHNSAPWRLMGYQTWWKWILQASRNFLKPPVPAETSDKTVFSETICLMTCSIFLFFLLISY